MDRAEELSGWTLRPAQLADSAAHPASDERQGSAQQAGAAEAQITASSRIWRLRAEPARSYDSRRQNTLRRSVVNGSALDHVQLDGDDVSGLDTFGTANRLLDGQRILAVLARKDRRLPCGAADGRRDTHRTETCPRSAGGVRADLLRLLGRHGKERPAILLASIPNSQLGRELAKVHPRSSRTHRYAPLSRADTDHPRPARSAAADQPQSLALAPSTPRRLRPTSS